MSAAGIQRNEGCGGFGWSHLRGGGLSPLGPGQWSRVGSEKGREQPRGQSRLFEKRHTARMPMGRLWRPRHPGHNGWGVHVGKCDGVE